MKKHYVPQVDARDCGVAALSMILKHHGTDLSLARLRELAKTTAEGTSALGLIEAAKKVNFETKAIQADETLFDMEELPYPFIAHVLKEGKLLHYYVVYKEIKDKILIADPDPTVKIIKMDKKRFLEEWSGVALFFAPEPAYKPEKEKKNGLLSFIPMLLKQKMLITQIVIASLLITLFNILGAYYLQGLIDTYIPNQMTTSLHVISIGLVITYIVKQLLSYAQEYLLNVMGQRLSIDVILGYIKHIFNLPMSFFSTRRTGEIVSRFTDANSIIDALASTILSLFLDVSIVLIVGIVLAIQSTQLFFLSLIAVPIYLVFVLAFMKPFERMNNETMQANALLSSSIIESINGIETIKSLASEQLSYQKVDKEFVDYLRKSFTYAKTETLQKALKEGAQLLLNVCILWYGAQLVINGEMTVGQLITYNTLLVYFTNPLENIINLQPKLQAAKVANNRLNEVYVVQSEFESDKKLSEHIAKDGDFVLDNISYRYGYHKDVLSGITLTIPKNSKTTFVGISGSGKTTLAKLLVNFYEPVEGTIKLGNQDIQQIEKKTLRKHVGYVSQEPAIYSGTVLENLIMGAKEGTTEDEIMKAVELAEIREDIEALPLGYQTELSAEATELSGGQKQRLALARAMLSDSPILILDEATSALDVKTEKRVVDHLMALENKTVIFIAHRLTIAERSENIVVLDKGKVIEEGNHTSLMKQQGFYYDLNQL
ncbi:peptide cleavage/export ABC transporter [Marinilactibacillus psychrotolerans]|uniref:peptide cleavage/export ABC transporter n=1 Tax=Marinilactibacillus psychrotolerans TaxID=191770 RepID=UPI001D0258A7